MRYRNKKKSVNALQVAGIAVFAAAVIFACSWFSYSLNNPPDDTSISTASKAAARSETATPSEAGVHSESAAPFQSEASAADKAPLGEGRSVPGTDIAAGRSSSGEETDNTAARNDENLDTDELTVKEIIEAGDYDELDTDELPANKLFEDEFTALSMDEQFAVLRELFPEGKYWTSIGTDVSNLPQEYACMIVSDESCDHDVNGYAYCHGYYGRTADEYTYVTNTQCLGFASMFSDILFGKDLGVETFYDYDSLGVGDHIRFLSYEHSVIVLEKTDEYITVVECNRNYDDCMIEWDRKITKDELLNEWADYEFLRRTN